MSSEQGDVVRYDAFISYSRAADDDLAPDLQRSLERLSKPWYSRKPFLRVLRDTTSFGASADLTRTITSSLDEAGHLVLLISPESARSPWTTQEVEHWLATKGPDTITSVITEWEADRALPPGDFNDLNDFDWNGPDVPPSMHGVSEAPLAVDLRWATDPADRTLDNARWRDAVAQTAAAIKGVKKDELIGELVAMRTQARIITSSLISGGVILLGVLVVALTLWLLAAGERDDALAERDRADAAAGDADARRLQAEQAEASATAAAAEAEAARREAEALTLEARARQAEAEGNAAEAEALRAQAEAQRDAADAASVEAAAAAARAADLRDEAVADAAAAQSAADASRLEAATQRMVRESLALATAAADAISSDLPLALSNALMSYDLAQDAVGDRQPGDTFISGDQNALGTLFDALTAHRRLVGAVSGEFARAATNPSGRLAAVEIPDRGVVLLDSSLELPDDRPSVGGGRVSFFPTSARGDDQERFVVARYRDVALHDVPDSLDDIAETTGVLTWPGPGGVLVAAADSTGEWIVGGTDRGELAVWRVGSPDPVARLDVAERINDVEFDPVSGAIAWGGVGRDDRAAGIVTLSSSAGVPAIIEQPAPAADFFEVSDISFRPCATSGCLLTLASRGAPLTFWEVSGGSATASAICEQRCPTPGVAVGWSADGARFGVGDDTGGIEVWSWSDGVFTPLATDITSPAGFNSSISFLGGDVLSTSQEPGPLHRWRAEAWSPISAGGRVMSGDGLTTNMNTVAHHSNGELIATGGEDGAVRLWRRDGASLVEADMWAPWCGPDCSAGSSLTPVDETGLCESVRGDRVADVDIVTTSSGRTLLAASTGHVSAACATTSVGSVLLFEIDDAGRLGPPTTLHSEPDGFIDAIAFDAPGCSGSNAGPCTLVAGGQRRTSTDAPGAYLWRWSVENATAPDRAAAVRIGSDNENRITSLAFSTQEIDGARAVIVGDRNGSVRLWSLNDVADAATMPPDPVAGRRLDGTVHVAIDDPTRPDRLLVAGHGGQAEIWDLSDAERPERLSEFGRAADFISDAAWTPDGRTVVLTSADGRIRIFDVTDATSPTVMVAPIAAHQSPVRGVSITPDGAHVTTVSDESSPPGRGIGVVADWAWGIDRLRSTACTVGRPASTSCPD